MALVRGSLPAAAAGILSFVTCPACWGAYAGVASALGVGTLLFTTAYVVVLAVVLALGLVSAAWSARLHRNPWPLFLTVVGIAAIVLGRVVVIDARLFPAGFAFLLGGSGLDLWLRWRWARGSAELAR